MMRKSDAESAMTKSSSLSHGRTTGSPMLEDSSSDSLDEYQDSDQEYSDDDSDSNEIGHDEVPFAFDPDPQVSMDLEDGPALAAVEQQMRQFEHKLGTDDDKEPLDEDDLHNGNIYPPEFYKYSIATFDPNSHRATVYAPKTQSALNTVEKQWRMSVRHYLSSSFCDADTEIIGSVKMSCIRAIGRDAWLRLPSRSPTTFSNGVYVREPPTMDAGREQSGPKRP